MTPSNAHRLFGVRRLDAALLGRGSTRPRGAAPSAAPSSFLLSRRPVSPPNSHFGTVYSLAIWPQPVLPSDVPYFPQFRNLPTGNPTPPRSSGSPLPNFHLSFDSSTPNRAFLPGTHAQTGFPLTHRKQTTVVLSSRYKKPAPVGAASWLPHDPGRISNRNSVETGFAVTHSKQTTVVLSNRNKKPPPRGVTTLQSCHSSPAAAYSNRNFPELEFVPSPSKQTTSQFLIATHLRILHPERFCGRLFLPPQPSQPVLFSLRPSFGYNGPYPAVLLQVSQAERN